MNTYIGNNNFLCNTNQKKKLHPSCARNQINKSKNQNKEERISKIKTFYRLFNEQVKQGSNLVNRKNKKKFSEYQERYVNFVRETRKDPDLRWIYEHFNYDINRNSLTLNPYYVNENLDIDEGLKKQKTVRQKIYIKALKSGELGKIEYEFENERKNRNSTNIIHKIDELLNNIELNQKINFNFNFDIFIDKCIRMREFMTSKDLFINKQIKNDIIQGEKDFDTIFPNEIFNFLISNDIIDFSLIFEYKLQYTHRFRKLAKLRLEELYTFYEHKINWIFDLLSSGFIENRDKIFLNNFIIDNIIKPYIKKYLFYINYTLNYLYDQKEFIFEIAFEDFYYYNLNLSLHFIRNFLKCINRQDLRNENRKQEGGYGDVYEILQTVRKKSNTPPYNYIFTEELVILKKSKKPVLEKQFFEFFKQLCICHEFNKNERLKDKIPVIYDFMLGETDVYISMEKLNGLNLLQYVYNNIELALSNRNIDIVTFKNKFFKNIFLKVGELVKDYQQVMFLHQDLNPRNVIVVQEGDSINLKLVDFDFSVIKANELFIFNYGRYIDMDHIFEKQNDKIFYTYFIISSDLIRFMIHFFGLPKIFKDLLFSKRQNITIENLNEHYNIPSTLLENLRQKLFGTDNPIIPFQILTEQRYIDYFEGKTSFRDSYFIKEFRRVKSLLKRNKIATFSGYFLVRKFIYDLFIRKINPTWKKMNWIQKYELWILPFLPHNFLKIIQSIPVSSNGGKKTSNKIKK